MAQASQDLISIRELRELAGRFFDVLESHGFSDIKVARSEYFTTFSIEAFDMDGQAVVAGDVWDDLEDVRKELPQHRDGDSEIIIWHAAHHLSGLFKLIAYAANGDGLTNDGSNRQ